MNEENKIQPKKEAIEQESLGTEEKNEAKAPTPPDNGLSGEREDDTTHEGSSEIEKLKKEITDLQDEKRGNEDKYLRLLAEFENYRKRVTRDQNEFSKYATESLLKDLLAVLDNLERALQHSSGTNDIKVWVEGVQLTFKQFSEILTKVGVTPIQTIGCPFDPGKQQAMAHVESDEHEENIVVEEYQKGYMLHDRVLRAALVTVSKGKGSQKPKEDSDK